MITSQYGLIGFPLSHSFSKKYFTQKFENEGISHAHYELFEIEDIQKLPTLLAQIPNLKGLNVTIPHKQAVLPFLAEIDEAAKRIGAVNVIKILENGKLKGYNSDYYGFRMSLEKMIGKAKVKALVLGTGGASLAVRAALTDMQIPYLSVSRLATEKTIHYEQIDKSLMLDYQLIINTTPLGMSPKTDTCPTIPYEFVGENHFFYDLVYNPEITLFMKKGLEKGAKIQNGLEMLHLQAEKAWEIWQK